MRRVGAQLLVCGQRHLEPQGAVDVRALAEELVPVRIGPMPVGAPFDLLVDLAKEHFVLRETLLPRVHEAAG